MLQPMPKRLFVACKDTTTDDFYLFASFIDRIEYKQSYNRTAEATETIEDSAIRVSHLKSIVVIQLVFSHVPTWSYISLDYGKSWNTFFTVLPPNVIYAIYSRSTFYALDTTYFYRSTDSGSSWAAISFAPVITDNPIFISISNLRVSAVYDNGKCAVSPSLGSLGSWHVFLTGLASCEKVIEVGNTLIAFNSSGANSRSTDRGLTWSAITPAPAVATLRDIALSDKDNRSILMALDNNTFYSSLDFGFTWIQMGAVITGTKYSLSHMTDFHFFGVNGAGFYDVSDDNGSISNQLPFDVGNTDIKPFAVFSLPTQTTEASESLITKLLNQRSVITKTKSFVSSVFSVFAWIKIRFTGKTGQYQDNGDGYNKFSHSRHVRFT